MDSRLIDSLKKSSIFSSLSEPDYRHIASLFEIIHLAENESLFSRGDKSDSIYLLISGVLSNYLINKDNELIVLGQVTPGHSVGEAGVLSDEPRMLTVKAEEACVLGKIPAEQFKALCLSYPSILQATIALIIQRSQQTINFIANDYALRWHLVMPVCEPSLLQGFKDNIMRHAQRINELSVENCSTLEQLNDLVGRRGRENAQILVFINSYELAEAFLQRVQNARVYFLANAQNSGQFLRQLPKINALIDQHSVLRFHLILLHGEHVINPEGTAAWLDKALFTSHYHVRVNQEKDYQRLLRFITGTATALVLGGGGAKAWVHVGLIKALQERNIEIDALGGTSAGALIGAIYMLEQSHEEFVDRVHHLTQGYYGIPKTRNLTWPLLSLFDPEPGRAVLRQAFQQRNIEDLWRPFFCVTTNLSTGEESLHHRGDIETSLYASSALPGLMPPLLIDGQLHYDGGLLNNLPVDVMRGILGADGTIIASSLSNNGMGGKSWRFPDKVTFLRYMRAKIGWDHGHSYPGLLENFFEALIIGSSMKERQNCEHANFLIQPDLSAGNPADNGRGFSRYHATCEEEKILMDIGYQEGIKVLDMGGAQYHDPC
ncbi:patatin-like phospholipase family protein [Legionella sp. CNM-4043-24]|uniref:patatin-like phospholipase family protein n=1 Tax=Legionella sp. CNM-4043-24 TaxID=3421646 RepID=UPI00403ADD83